MRQVSTFELCPQLFYFILVCVSWFLLVGWFFRQSSHSVAEAGLELVILLPQPSE